VPRQWYLSRFTGVVLCVWGGAILWTALR
jgi:hypothetical protein